MVNKGNTQKDILKAALILFGLIVVPRYSFQEVQYLYFITDLFAVLIAWIFLSQLTYDKETNQALSEVVKIIIIYFILAIVITVLIIDTTYFVELLTKSKLSNLSDRLSLANVIAFVYLTTALIGVTISSRAKK